MLSLPGSSLEGDAMGFFPGESLVRPPGWLRKAEGGATLIPCPSGFGRLDIFSRFTTGTKRLYVERGCTLGGREAGSGPRILAQDHLLSWNLGGLLQGYRTRDKGILYSLEQVEGRCRAGSLPPRAVPIAPWLLPFVSTPPWAVWSGLVSGSLQPFLTRGCPSGSSQEAGGHGCETPGPSPWRRFW